ncbi:hypothetical protein E2C01_055798 [Portunus trituberculatus]|uniref:Uncharacterized protein n=1 Tax=Portunus trituberculatus TaxID=210409 RepID=A0A5B7GVQ4_PORTR|nr:hypothetical protein [Portunus trituberculatus]
MMKQKSITVVKVEEKERHRGKSEQRFNTLVREKEIVEEEEQEESGRRSRRRRRRKGEEENAKSCEREEVKGAGEADAGAECVSQSDQLSDGRPDGRQARVRRTPRSARLACPPAPPRPAPQLRPQRQGGMAGKEQTPPTTRMARRRTSDRYRTFVIVGEGSQASPRQDKPPLTSESPLASSSSSSSFSFSPKPELQTGFSTFLSPSSAASTCVSEGTPRPEVLHHDSALGDALMKDYRNSRSPGGFFSSSSIFRPLGELRGPTRPAWRQQASRGVKFKLETSNSRLGSAGSSVSSSCSSSGLSFPLASSSAAWHSAFDIPLTGHRVLRNPVFKDMPEAGSEITVHGSDASKAVVGEAAPSLTAVQTLAEVHQPAAGRGLYGFSSDLTGDFTPASLTIPEESLVTEECARPTAELQRASSFMSLPVLQSAFPQPVLPPPSLLASSSDVRVAPAILTPPPPVPQDSQRTLVEDGQRRNSRIPLPWPPLLPGSGLLRRGGTRRGKASAAPRNNFEVLILEGLEKQSAPENWILRQQPVARTPSLPAQTCLPDGVPKKPKGRERLFGYGTITKVKHSFESFLMNQQARAAHARDGNSVLKKRVLPRLGSRRDSIKGSKASEQNSTRAVPLRDTSKPLPPSAGLKTPWLARRREDKSVKEGPPLLWPPRDIGSAAADTSAPHTSAQDCVGSEPGELLRVTESPFTEQPLQGDSTQHPILPQDSAVLPTGSDAEGSQWGPYTTQEHPLGVSEGVKTFPYEALRGSHYILEAAVQLPSKMATEGHARDGRMEGTKGRNTWNSHGRGRRRKRVVGCRKYNTVSRLMDIRPRKGILKKTLSGGSLPSTLHRRRAPKKAVVTYRLPSSPRRAACPRSSSTAPCPSPDARHHQPRAEVDAGYECDTELSVGETEQPSDPAPPNTTTLTPPHTRDPTSPSAHSEKIPTPPPPPPSRYKPTFVVST